MSAQHAKCRRSVAAFAYQVEKYSFVGFDALMTCKTAEFDVIDEKLHFHLPPTRARRENGARSHEAASNFLEDSAIVPLFDEANSRTALRPNVGKFSVGKFRFQQPMHKLPDDRPILSIELAHREREIVLAAQTLLYGKAVRRR